MQDRPYQVEAKAAVLSQWDGGTRRTLLVMPTGTGKTIVFARIIEVCPARLARPYSRTSGRAA